MPALINELLPHPLAITTGCQGVLAAHSPSKKT
jgi:hypothetical protein